MKELTSVSSSEDLKVAHREGRKRTMEDDLLECNAMTSCPYLGSPSWRRYHWRTLSRIQLSSTERREIMFIIDDLIGQAVGYLFTRVAKSREAHDESIDAIRQAMRGLSASFGDIIYVYKKCSHKLQRFVASSDYDGFWNYFSEVLDEDRLRVFCNESGICKDLRIAQDKLVTLPFGSDSTSKEMIEGFASQLEAYEIAFIAAIHEYFSKAEKLDLIAAKKDRDVDPQEALDIFEKCLVGLEREKKKVDSILEEIRAQASRSLV